LTAGCDNRRKETSWQRERIVGGSGPRLLEVLEQRVRRVLVHQIRAEDEVDAALGLERAHMEVAPQAADRVDADLAAQRLEHVQVRMGAARDPRGIAEQFARERDRGAPFAHTAGAVEEVGVRRTFREGGAEERLRLLLLREGLEGVHG
jgi:hypothetical protein